MFETGETEEEEFASDDIPTSWWKPLCHDGDFEDVECSSKLMLLFSILNECNISGDKLLVFSQSLFALNVIEKFLGMIHENTQNPNSNAKLGAFHGHWKKNLDYFRLDGSTPMEDRKQLCDDFNDAENKQARYYDYQYSFD